MRFKNKKSMSQLTFMILVSIIILLVILLVVFLFFNQFKVNSDRLLQKEMCKESVSAASIFKLRVVGVQLIDDLGRAAPLKCYTQYEKVPSGKELQMISTAMYDCWDQFNQGKSEIFDTRNNNYCVICSRLEFEKKAEITGLTGYMMNTNIPGGNEKYFEFLSGYKVDDKTKSDYANSNLINLESVDTSIPQAVIFVMEKHASSQAAAGTGVGVAAGIATAGILILSGPITGGASWVLLGSGLLAGGSAGYFFGSHTGATNYDAIVLVTPYDELSNLQCTVLEGHAKPLEVVGSTLDSK